MVEPIVERILKHTWERYGKTNCRERTVEQMVE